MSLFDPYNALINKPPLPDNLVNHAWIWRYVHHRSTQNRTPSHPLTPHPSPLTPGIDLPHDGYLNALLFTFLLVVRVIIINLVLFFIHYCCYNIQFGFIGFDALEIEKSPHPRHYIVVIIIIVTKKAWVFFPLHVSNLNRWNIFPSEVSRLL